MEKRLDNNGYIDFPFPATRNADGSVNPCGFDLTLETGRLEEIAVLNRSANLRRLVEEIAVLNRSANLRRLVEEINLQEGLFMTLACDWQQQPDAVCGFIDVAFRPDLPQHGFDEALQLEANFYRYLTGQEKQHQMPAETLVNYARSVLDWSWSPLRQRQREYEKITIQFYCPQADDAEWCFDHLRHFLVSVYPACVAGRSL